MAILVIGINVSVITSLDLKSLYLNSIVMAFAGAVFATLWGAVIFYILLQFYYGNPASRSPDLELTRVLVDAFAAAEAGKSMSRQAFIRRCDIAANICVAANLLERPMVRLLTQGDKAAEAIVRPLLRTAAAGLRQNLAHLAIPNGNTPDELARSLGKTVLAVATDDYSYFVEPQASASAVVAVSWHERLLTFARWLALAIGSGPHCLACLVIDNR